MARRSPFPAGLLLAPLALLAAACDEDSITAGPPDLGLTADAGSSTGLPLRVGDRFEYTALLTYTDQSVTDDISASYDLTLIIVAVDDQGSQGPSSVTVTASGSNLVNESWTLVHDVDVWGAQLGPTLATDGVQGAAQAVALDGAPDKPGLPKTLPSLETFFIDVRDIETLRTEWNTTHANRNPQVLTPDTTGSTWDLRYEGTDSTIVYFSADAKRRRISLVYDERGYLRSLSEDVGDLTQTAPRATVRLTLKNPP